MRTAPRTPHDIPYTDIEVSLGVPWVSKTIISDFIYFLRTGNEAFAATGKMLKTYVSYEPMTGYWYVEDKNLWGRDGVDRKYLRSAKLQRAVYSGGRAESSGNPSGDGGGNIGGAGKAGGH